MKSRFVKLITRFSLIGGVIVVALLAVVITILVAGIATNDNNGSDTVSNQPSAQQYDQSKANATAPVTRDGFDLEWIDKFHMDAADPPFVNGEYIDRWLRANYPQSPLIGHGKTIKKFADYYGVSVGAFMGQIAQETTFGIASCGGR